MDMQEFVGAAPKPSPLDISLPALSHGEDSLSVEPKSDSAVLEPTNEELLREKFDGLDPWFFEGNNTESALQKLVEKDPERAIGILETLRGLVYIDGLVLREDGDDMLVTDTLHPAEIKLLAIAESALEQINKAQETDTHPKRTVKEKLTLGGVAAGTVVAIGGLATTAIAPQVAAAATYGPISGVIVGTALGYPMLRQVWINWHESQALKKRGDECAYILEGIQQKIANDNEVTRVVDKWLDDIDVKKIKKSRDPDFVPYLNVIEQHQDSVRSHTKKVGEAIIAKFRGEYYDDKGKRRSKNELWLNPKEAVIQLLEMVSEIDPVLPKTVWTGDGTRTGMKEVVQRITSVTEKLALLKQREDIVLAIDNDVRHQQKDDIGASESFDRQRAVLKKEQAIAMLDFIRLRQFVMRELSPSGSGIVTKPQWQVFGRGTEQA